MRTRTKKTVRFFICISLMVLFFATRWVWNIQIPTLEKIISVIAYPILVVQHTIAAPFKQYQQRAKTVQELHDEVEQLRTDKKNLLAEVVELHSLLFYAQKTEELINFKQQYTTSTATLAHIMLKQFSDQEHCCFVDKGSQHGIAPDMVAVYKNNVVGRVAVVYPYYSKIVFVTDRSCKIASYCAQTKACGISEGTNKKDSLQLRYVSHLHQLQKHDRVLSSGEGLVFPQGFAVGEITSFAHDGLYYVVTMKPLLELDSIDYCYLMQKGATV